MFLKDHEKFIAFVLLGAALVTIAIMVYLRPISGNMQNGAALAILNTIVGALTLAFGGAANALFKISASDKVEIGRAAADAVSSDNSKQPTQVEITNTEDEPVPTTAAVDNSLPEQGQEELPDYAR